jgi:release factor glutamine methyltransferase
LRSVKTLLQSGSAILEHVSETPRLDAELLLGALLNQERVWMLAHSEEIVTDDLCAAFDEAISRRARHEPVAYILGHKFFWESQFRVTPAVLIPRPETEMLVQEAVAFAVQHQQTSGRPLRVLDLGTGSGCIGISVALELEKRQIPLEQLILSDISPDALAVAKENIDQILSATSCNKVTTLVSDWLSAVEGRFDLILSNPPYIARDDTRVYQGAQYEPQQALYADDTNAGSGLAAIEQIILGAEKHLSVGGAVMIECGDTQAQDIHRLAKHHHCAARSYTDLSGKERGVILTLAAPQ